MIHIFKNLIATSRQIGLADKPTTNHLNVLNSEKPQRWERQNGRVYADYRQERDEMRQLLMAKANVELLLGIDDKPMEQESHNDREQR